MGSARLLKDIDIEGGPGFLNKWFERRIGLNKNVLIAITGPTGCLSGDTILYGQDKNLSELFKEGNIFLDTYSLDINKGHSKKSKSELLYSGKKEVYEIELEDGRKVLATEEHRFFDKEGKEIKLKDLNIDSELLCHKENEYAICKN